ncbi:unnamed protein product [Peniophora sp. CBMAI 1063]|nr:unnamed protein product [Peniophora sp. CBMAI 1063]
MEPIDRQIRPIYDAIDHGAYKQAVATCNKLLKRYPKNDLVKALKALALVRMQKVEEPMALCDEVLAAKPTDEGALSAMSITLRTLGRHADSVTMYEEAFKRLPQSEEMAAQTFCAYVRCAKWKNGQLLATKMNKMFPHNDHYQYWAAMCAVLQANEPATAPNMRDILYKLAHRVISNAWKATEPTAERLYLYLRVLRELKLHEEALELLKSEVGQILCARSLACDEMRRFILQDSGAIAEASETSKKRIADGDRNWLDFLAVLDGYVPTSGSAETTADTLAEARAYFQDIAEKDGRKDRAGLLALLELEKRAKTHRLSQEPTRLEDSLRHYFDTFGDKAVCFEDLLPYISLDGEELAQWTQYLDGLPSSLDDVPNVQRTINVHKLRRFNLSGDDVTPESESARALQLIQQYMDALPIGAGFPKTELQPADDLAILAAQGYVNAYSLSRDESYLNRAAVILEYGLTKSSQCFKMRLMLIRIYRLLSAAQLALDHYRALEVKQVQCDTMSHYVLSRSSLFSHAATGDITYLNEITESSLIYISNSSETADYSVRAFVNEKYSQIENFIEFEDRLDNSLARDVIKLEHVRMRMTFEPIMVGDLVDMEALELKFIFDRVHHDNRDREVLPSYQPRSRPSFYDQTLLFDKDTELGWLNSFLRVYIRVFKLASDMDNSVEEKLLIGDRPKPSNNEEMALPLDERLVMRKPEELEELTPEETAFFEYATALCDWLAPYHEYSRPPADAVLAEADKQSQLRAKGINPSFSDGPITVTNGIVKKDEEPPAFKEPPPSLVEYFDGVQNRFRELLSSGARLYELLEVATLAQEALICFTIETLRFRNAALVKAYKFSALVQSFKDVRVRALDVMEEIGTEMTKLGETLGTQETRKVFVDSCADLETFPALTHERILDIAKNVTDARKKLAVGSGKGYKKVAKVHSA